MPYSQNHHKLQEVLLLGSAFLFLRHGLIVYLRLTSKSSLQRFILLSFMCVSVYVCVCVMYMYVYVCVCMCMYVCVDVCACLSIGVCTCVYACV